VLNALGMGIGFTLGLLALGSVREILGIGKLFGVSLFGEHFQPWVVMVLPPGGFFVLGGWLLLFAWLAKRKHPHPLPPGEGATAPLRVLAEKGAQHGK